MQDDNTTQTTNDNADSSTSADSNIIEPTLGLGSNPSDQQQSDMPTDTSPDTSEAEQPADDATIQIQNDNSQTDATESAVTPDDSGEEISETNDTEEEASAPDSSTPAPSDDSGDLDSIRSEALQELAPLVSELDQEPEEKYRTLMMIIQSSDNQSLIKQAYEAAESIKDKKARAEALLTIVHEINYFTGKDKSQPEV